MTAQVMAQSRMGLGSTVLALAWVVFVFALANGRWFVGLVFLVLLGALIFSLSFSASMSSSACSVQSRSRYPAEHLRTLELWQSRPWTGFGMGSFETVFAVGKDRFRSPLDRAHNSYITALVELGMIGSATYVRLCLAWVGPTTRGLRSALSDRLCRSGLSGACSGARSTSASRFTPWCSFDPLAALSSRDGQRHRPAGFTAAAQKAEAVQTGGSASTPGWSPPPFQTLQPGIEVRAQRS